jgi:uncharacterized protein (TIGR00369 family)
MHTQTNGYDLAWEARDADYEQVIRNTYAAQPALALIGATLGRVEPGFVELHLPTSDRLSSHIPGIVHGGVVGMIADSVMGFAALSVAAPGSMGVTAEYKLNLLAPPTGDVLVARGEVVKPGRRVTVARADVYAITPDRERLVATALATMMSLA